MSKTTRSMVDSASEYASHGLRVFPCEPAGKRPLIKNWPDLATTDPDQIRELWATRPNANIGILTGKETGILVVDLDTKGDGPENMSQLEAKHGQLPVTPKAITGSGGAHLIFKYPDDVQVKSLTAIVSGIDTRGDGGYFIAAPSIHPSGREYEWAPGCGLGEVEPAVCPIWLLQLISSKRLRLVGRDESATQIRRGERNSKLTSLAGSMRHRGMTPEAIEAALLIQNSSCCPPLPEDEVVGIVRSVSRYEPAAETMPLTELGNAERLVRDHGIDIRYYPNRKKWLVWDGIRWKPDQIGLVKRLVNDSVRKMREEARLIGDADKRKELLKFQKTSESGKSVREILGHASSLEGIPVVPEDLDTNPWLINVNNGEIDLKTGELLPHRRENLITKLAPVTFNPTATCPTWIAFLEKIMDENKDMISFLQRAIGYSLTGDTREQCVFILHGNGSNGKSTFLNAITALFGEDYAINTPMETLMVRKGEGARNDIAALNGSRLVTAIEAEKGQTLAESMVKSLSGGDKMTARFLYGEYFTFIPEFKLFLATNHKPLIKGTDNAIWRRIRLAPFAITIREEDKDLNLSAKLLVELSGILNWAIEGCLLWQKEGLGVPDEVKAATAEYRAEMDVMEAFLDECCVRGTGLQEENIVLIAAYQGYCSSNGETPEKQRGFTSRLRELGFNNERSKSTGRMVWFGLRLIPAPDEERDFRNSNDEAVRQLIMKDSRGSFSTDEPAQASQMKVVEDLTVEAARSESEGPDEELDNYFGF